MADESNDSPSVTKLLPVKEDSPKSISKPDVEINDIVKSPSNHHTPVLNERDVAKAISQNNVNLAPKNDVNSSCVNTEVCVKTFSDESTLDSGNITENSDVRHNTTNSHSSTAVETVEVETNAEQPHTDALNSLTQSAAAEKETDLDESKSIPVRNQDCSITDNTVKPPDKVSNELEDSGGSQGSDLNCELDLTMDPVDSLDSVLPRPPTDKEDENNEDSLGTPPKVRRRSNSERSAADLDVPIIDPATSSDSSIGTAEAVEESSSDGEADTEVNAALAAMPNKWSSLKSLRRREENQGHPFQHPDRFREASGGSAYLTERLQLRHKLEFHRGCVNSLHFNSSGSLLVSGSDDLSVCIWDWQNNRQALNYESGHRNNVFQTKFMPFTNDAQVVSCARDGQVRLAELSLIGVCRSTRKVAQHRGSVHALSLIKDDSHTFLSAAEDAVTFEIDLRQPKPNKLLVTKDKDRKIALYTIDTNPIDSNYFCVGGRDPYVRIYDRRRLNNSDGADSPLKKFAPHLIKDAAWKPNVTEAVYSYNGGQLIGSYNDDDIYLFDATHSDEADSIRRYYGHRNNATVKGVNFYGPKSEYIVSGSDCSHILLWDKETARIVNVLCDDEDGISNVLEPHPHDPVLATSGLSHDIKIWWPSNPVCSRLPSDQIRKFMRKNRKDRQVEREHDPSEMIDSRMLWFLMRHMRRRRRRRRRRRTHGQTDGEQAPAGGNGAEAASSGSDSSSTSSSGDEDDSEEGESDDSSDTSNPDRPSPRGGIQCATS